MPQTIYLVEDDVNIRELICYALKAAGFEAMGFETGADFFKAVTKNLRDLQNRPVLVLLDIMLPGESGIVILNRLKVREDTSDLPVMMLTAKDSEIDKVSALDAGADDYMVKPFGVMELISRVKALLRRSGGTPYNALSSADELCVGTLTVNLPKRTVTEGENEVNLTYKEFELLVYLLQNKGIVLTRDKIMQTVWGFDFEGESRTVDMHIKLLRQKLCENGKQIQTVRGVGYKISEEKAEVVM